MMYIFIEWNVYDNIKYSNYKWNHDDDGDE
jgi:hypothetical protein